LEKFGNSHKKEKNMRYYHYHGETAYCGTDIDEYLALPDDEELDIEEYEEAMIQQLFDSYSYLATGWDEESDDPDFEEEFKADCSVYLVEITKEQYNEEMGVE
jgi:hypothetical protein